MIRVSTLEHFDDKQIKKLCDQLYAAFGVGCEHSGNAHLPGGFSEPLDSNKALTEAPRVRAFADDKIVYLTQLKLKDRSLPTGSVPTQGNAWYGKDRAVVTTYPKKDLEDGLKLVVRHSMHQLGHLWELHHCLDPRCAMYPPWTPSFASGDTTFCTFCRDKSEQKIRLAKS